MSYTAPPIFQSSMPMVDVGSMYASNVRHIGVTSATSAWTNANLARYVPFRISAGVTVARLWARVGTIGGTDNWDLGIYTDGGTQIVHMGATLAGTASTIQFMNITDTYLAPGAYYLAMSSNGTTAHTWGYKSSLAADVGKLTGLLEQATAHPLPATATFATAGGPTQSWPAIGYCTTATP